MLFFLTSYTSRSTRQEASDTWRRKFRRCQSHIARKRVDVDVEGLLLLLHLEDMIEVMLSHLSAHQTWLEPQCSGK